LIQINADCGDGELMRPAELAVEKSGNVIVVDSGNNRLQFFKPDGTFVGKCGRAGKGDGEFNEPWGPAQQLSVRGLLAPPAGTEIRQVDIIVWIRPDSV
jgi:DNA-binding beta-propeller fold protein YncE